jgi:cyanate lyase
MRRDELTEKILDIKRKQGWSWRHITNEIGGVSPVLIVGALLGQMKLVKPLAKKAAKLFGLSEDEERMLNEVPLRGTQMPPTDPLLYRFYELVMVNGPAWKALIEESSATESCRRSISTWRSSVSRMRRVTASRSP